VSPEAREVSRARHACRFVVLSPETWAARSSGGLFSWRFRHRTSGEGRLRARGDKSHPVGRGRVADRHGADRRSGPASPLRQERSPVIHRWRNQTGEHRDRPCRSTTLTRRPSGRLPVQALPGPPRDPRAWARLRSAIPTNLALRPVRRRLFVPSLSWRWIALAERNRVREALRRLVAQIRASARPPAGSATPPRPTKTTRPCERPERALTRKSSQSQAYIKRRSKSSGRAGSMFGPSSTSRNL
jgi:hypothetical protein